MVVYISSEEGCVVKQFDKKTFFSWKAWKYKQRDCIYTREQSIVSLVLWPSFTSTALAKNSVLCLNSWARCILCPSAFQSAKKDNFGTVSEFSIQIKRSLELKRIPFLKSWLILLVFHSLCCQMPFLLFFTNLCTCFWILCFECMWITVLKISSYDTFDFFWTRNNRYINVYPLKFTKSRRWIKSLWILT